MIINKKKIVLEYKSGVCMWQKIQRIELALTVFSGGSFPFQGLLRSNETESFEESKAFKETLQHITLLNTFYTY